MSASETPKSRLDTSSFPPFSCVVTPSNMSCCHRAGKRRGFPRPPRAGNPALPPRPLPRRFCLMISSKDMSSLSAMTPQRWRQKHFR
uniref:Uncharacterized protein n=1 Tax=Eptatretus burgeri TaxID=7764 RepID=A0A8C4WXU7_EPTBU